MRRPASTLVLRGLALLLAAAALCALPLHSQAPEPVDVASPFLVATDVPYVDGSDDPRHTLDIYAPPAAAATETTHLPVLVYVHGGALVGGDKTRVGDKPAFFCPRGWVLVSFNYRLTPAVRHPEHLRDAAAAVAWVARNVGRYGGDRERIALVGHSAGAFLAALLATDHRRLGTHGLGLDVLAGAVLLDGVEYALEDRIREYAPVLGPDVMAGVYAKFGSEPELWHDASAMHHVAADKGIPPILLVAAGVPFQHWVPGREARIFRDALHAAGVPSEYYFATRKTHGEVNSHLTTGDAMSRTVMDFLNRHVVGNRPTRAR